LTLYTHVF
jgi:lactate dehydrogenase-like 2-hydroxyacid dehydrogenase